MSKATLGFIAIASSATGAALMYAFGNARLSQQVPSKQPAIGVSRLASQERGPVDPAGFFQYGMPGLL
jgi:hypothetical protein